MKKVLVEKNCCCFLAFCREVFHLSLLLHVSCSVALGCCCRYCSVEVEEDLADHDLGILTARAVLIHLLLVLVVHLEEV